MLAGIQTGVLGGAAMFVWLAASSLLDLRSAWAMPNLLGAALSGRPPVERGFGWLTVSGLGLHLAIAGLVGLLFGLAVGGSRNRLRVTLLGIITGLFLYYGSQYVLWRKLGIQMIVYSPPRPTLAAYLIYGLALGCAPAAGARIALEEIETPVAPEAVE